MNRFYTQLIIILLLIFSITVNGQKKKKVDYLLYSVKSEKLVQLSDIIEDLENYNILFYGEEHNDITTHNVQAELLRMIYEKYSDKTVLSMEMFERDVQFIVDEYFDGLIKEKYFTKDARAWGNYNDYRPMVEFAKKNNLTLIAANAPFRYVNLVSTKGVDTLMMISDRAKEAVAPLPYNIAEGDYKQKLRDLGKSEKEKEKEKADSLQLDTTKQSYDAVLGHSLWDATMAYSIYQHFKTNPDSKVFHLNGKFHTEEHYGIVQRLKEFDENLTSLVITSISDEKKFPHIDFKEYAHLGDYIIFTNPKNKKSY